MRSIGYLGNRRLDAARQRLPVAVSAWREQWCLGAEVGAHAIQMTLSANDADEIDAGAMHLQQACTSNGSIWLGAKTGTCWQHLLFGHKSRDVPADELATHLCLQSQLALANALLKALHHDEVSTLMASASTDAVMRNPGVRISITGSETSILMLLDASLLDAWLPLPPAREPLWSRQHAIGSTRIPVRLMLPLATASASSLIELNLGDIICLKTPLSRRFNLETDRGALIGEGIPVAANGLLAVQLIDR